MSRVWEEEWAPGDGVLHTEDVRIAVFEPINRPHEPLSAAQVARAKLAAAAPDLARVLLEVIQQMDHAYTEDDFLAGMNALRPAIDTALRKAGVR